MMSQEEDSPEILRRKPYGYKCPLCGKGMDISTTIRGRHWNADRTEYCPNRTEVIPLVLVSIPELEELLKKAGQL